MGTLHLKNWDEPFLIDDAKMKLFDSGSVVEIRGKPIYKRYVKDGKYEQMALATLISGQKPGPGQRWSHKNGNTFDYRRSNLELVGRDPGEKVKALNATRNVERARQLVREPGGKMVGVNCTKGRWYARISDPNTNKSRSLGGFDTEDAAGRAYDFARVQYGLPRVNFPEPDVSAAS